MSLVKAYIPDGVTCIAYRIFARCSSLEEVRYTGTKEEWAAVKKNENRRAPAPHRGREDRNRPH